MQSINEKFTGKEFTEMKKIKENHSMNWHDIILHAIRAYDEEL